MKFRGKFILKLLLVYCIAIGLLFGNIPPVYAGANADTEAELIAAIGEDGDELNIYLGADITVNDGIAISGKDIIFHLNGHTLNIKESNGPGLVITNGTVDIADSGELNVEGTSYGLQVNSGGTATVTNATATGAGTGAHVQGGGTAVIQNSVTGTGTSRGVVVVGEDSRITVGQNVSAIGDGAVANNNGEIVVGVNVISRGIGLRSNGGNIQVGGSVLSQDNDGAQATNGGKIHVDYNLGGLNHGAYASGSGSLIEVGEEALATGDGGWGAGAFSGAKITVGKNSKGGHYGCMASGEESTVSVEGNSTAVDDNGVGGFAYEGGTVVIKGNALGALCGVAATEDGFAYIGGSAVTSPGGIGAHAYGSAGNSGIITVDGEITGGTYIKVGTNEKNQGETTNPTTMLGYVTYSDSNANTVWVLVPDAGIIVVPAVFTSVGGSSVITVTGQDLPDGITVTAFSGADPAVTGITDGTEEAQTVTINFPANTSTTADKVYTVKASLDAGSTWGGRTLDVTVAKAASGHSSSSSSGSSSSTLQKPTVVTNTVSDITSSGAIISGDVTADGGTSVTQRGFVYGTGINPTLENGSKVTAGNGKGEFTATLLNLTWGTTYHVRAYAINSKGTSYGQDVSFTNQMILKFYINSMEYKINNQTLSADAAPVIINDRTFLPVRYVSVPLGASVEWDDLTNKVTVILKDTRIEMWIGSNMASVNGINEMIDPNNPEIMPVILPPGRTMLPMRFLAEKLGCEVNWDPLLKEVKLTYPKP